ncbi:hypothetical protein GYMLUDRAFT_58995 [Collybiopsis luxurians FD-317 M1]|uniref:Uncharacterized protein n=1 Tax=Collybiopsis luxurians FD-317 M1 TaxID=944289 RepID=A0A0D0BBA4_9AGAR|nr:hypothetical protein GYMLUDRAFT_58995 [Collybiopsis luxurians FD-317 M1]
MALCIVAQKRNRLESDLYPLWDAVWNVFAYRTADKKNEVTVSVTSQYTLEVEFRKNDGTTAFHAKIPDSLIFKIDDTRRETLMFWVEAKSLTTGDWFSLKGRAAAKEEIDRTIKQVNTQAQFAWIHFKLPETAIAYAFIVCGPYFILLEYRKDAMSPDFFSAKYARKNAAQTRNAVPAEGQEDDDEYDDQHTKPTFPLDRKPLSLFHVSEAQLAAQSFNLYELHSNKVSINEKLFEAFRIILTRHETVRNKMQNVGWFDCNYA